MAVKVGSFTKSTNTSVPASQAVTGVGFKPRALLMWTSGAITADTFEDSFMFGFGLSARNAADTITAGAVSGASQDNVANMNSSQRVAAKALTICEWSEALLAECDLASFDTDGFTLSWTTNNDQAYIISYMALGGPDLTDAKVIAFDAYDSTGTEAYTGAGFQPDCVWLLLSSITSAPPATAASAYISVGAMTSAAQFVSAFMERDGYASGLGFCYIHTDAVLYRFTPFAGAGIKATYSSMDADGFTLNYSLAGAGQRGYALCLKGGSYKIASFQTGAVAAAPADVAVTGVGFRPDGVFFANTNRAALSGSSSDGTTNAFCATTGSAAETAQSIYDAYGKATIDTKRYATSSRALIKLAADGSIAHSADGKTMDADGFTVTWLNTTVNIDAALYFAFAGGAVAAAGSALLMQHYHHSEFHGGGHQ